MRRKTAIEQAIDLYNFPSKVAKFRSEPIAENIEQLLRASIEVTSIESLASKLPQRHVGTLQEAIDFYIGDLPLWLP